MHSRSLIFPFDTSIGEILFQNRRPGDLFASSLRGSKEEIIYLPFIFETNFESILLELVEDLNIQSIKCTTFATYFQISNLIKTKEINCQVLDYTYLHNINVNLQKLKLESLILPCIDIKRINVKEMYRSILNCLEIPGESSLMQLTNLYALAQNIENGSALEIGAFYGRSSCLIASGLQPTTSLISVDPWSYSESIQSNSSELLSQVSFSLDWDEIQSQFINNLEVVGNQEVNYFKGTSNSFFDHFSVNKIISTKEFGSLTLPAKFNLIHIDGNHSLENLMEDLVNSLNSINDYGWIVIDDINWVHDKDLESSIKIFLNGLKVDFRYYIESKGMLFIQI
jgi:hypothetical protein